MKTSESNEFSRNKQMSLMNMEQIDEETFNTETNQ